jgi:glyoxylase-like metal-dependent hydrolase (beta-lactamase superfamily II)
MRSTAGERRGGRDFGSERIPIDFRAMKLGNLEFELVTDGTFRLDGGAMFGVVPRVLWQRHKPPDDENRILMGTNCLLVRSGDELVLVDTGIGDKHDADFCRIFGLEEGARRLPDSIRQAGYEPEDISHVLLTHLHFDHCGWNTRRSGEKLVPTFPRARYWLARGEVEHGRSRNERDRASYVSENWEPLFEAGVVELFEDEAQPAAGVRAIKAPGHNADMCIVRLDGGGANQAVYWADLVPTTAHVPLPWIMSYDLFPMKTLAEKKRWLPQAAAEGWLCIFEHDPERPLGRVVEEKSGRFKAVDIDGAGEPAADRQRGRRNE